MSDEPFFFTWGAQKGARGLEIVGGDGAFFDTADGARWLDFGSLSYQANLGHGNARMVAAVRAQAERLCITTPNAIYPEKRALARRLLEIAGEGFSKVFFTLGGSEAVENALKIARLATGRHKVLSRYRSYHGATMGALSLTGDYRRPPLEPGLVGAVKAMDCYCDRCPFGQQLASCQRECASQLADTLQLEGNIAAVFLEPIPGANGVLVPPADYWPRVRAACDASGSLLVADEVLTGFGRTGTWLAHQHWGVTPDLITVSKGLTAGYGVLGAVIVHERVAAHFEDHSLLAGLTQYAHPLGVAAALEAIAIYEDDGLLENAAALGPRLLAMLEGVASRQPAVRFTRGLGLLAALELGLDEPKMAAVARGLVERRLYTHVRAPDRTVMISPPLCIALSDLEDGVGRVEAAIAAASA